MSRRGWTLARAGAATLAVALLSPVDPVVLLAVPTAVAVAALRRRSPVAVAAAVLVLAVAFRGVLGGADPLSLAVRGWGLALGGGFVAVTVLRPDWTLVGRGISAVAAAGAVTGVAGAMRPGLLTELDWWVRRDLGGAAVAARQWLPDGVWSAADGWPVAAAQAGREALYPALLAAASLAALSVSWYVSRRIVGDEGGLGSFREFRFDDRLAWGLLAGLALMAGAPGDGLVRAGQNLVAFLGGLYLLRGIAILYCVGRASAGSARTAALWLVAGVVLYPLAVAAALVLGLGDAWTDVRGRLTRRLAARRTGGG